MNRINKELLEKFNEIHTKQQIYKHQNQENLIKDNKPMSHSISKNHGTTDKNSSPVSLISHPSFSPSSISNSIIINQQTKHCFNFKNSINQIDNSLNNQLNDYQLMKNSNDQINSQNKLEINNAHVKQINFHIKPSKLIDSFSKQKLHQTSSSFKHTQKASTLIAKINAISMDENRVNNEPNKKIDLKNSYDSNHSIIPPININELAKHSIQFDSNLSDNSSECVSNSNSSSLERNESENLIIENPFLSIKLNPFLQNDEKVKKLFKAAKEIRDTEEAYVNALNLICVKYKEAVRKSISPAILDQILQPFTIIHQLSSVLLNKFNHCYKNYEKNPKIAFVLVNLGPFLKHYADFFTKFEQINNNFAEMKRKHPAFREATEKFEQESICNKLTLSHYMLKPIQRIGQYKLLIQQYIKYMENDLRHPDYKNAIKALQIVTEAAEFSNERMKENEKFAKLLEIQQCIIGGYEIIKPYRRLVKQARLYKISRKIKQERLFILCNDCLIYLTILKENTYKVNHEMNLNGMRISSPDQEAFQNEILIISSQRSIRVVTSSLAEKEEWMNAINTYISQIQNNSRRKSTIIRPDKVATIGERPLCLGEEAPVWIPDERVSMCQICAVDFNVANRRHHCRACGQVVCSKCSKQKHYLRYSRKKERVCDNCFNNLTKHAMPEQEENISQDNLIKSNNQLKLSSSDPTINNANNDNRSDDQYTMTSFHKKVRRNSSNLTSYSSRSSKSSIFFVENDEIIPDQNEEVLSNLLKNETKVNEKQIDKQNNFFYGFIDNTDKTLILDEPLPTFQPEFQRNLNLRQSGRKRLPKVLTEISANEKENDMAGYMYKRKGKKNWRKFWFVLKSNVLYSFKQAEDVIALDSLPILGYNVQTSEMALDGQPANLTLLLTHQNLPDLHFRFETKQCVEKWFKALKKGTGLIQSE